LNILPILISILLSEKLPVTTGNFSEVVKKSPSWYCYLNSPEETVLTTCNILFKYWWTVLRKLWKWRTVKHWIIFYLSHLVACVRFCYLLPSIYNYFQFDFTVLCSQLGATKLFYTRFSISISSFSRYSTPIR